MTIRESISKIRVWGVPGILDYFRKKRHWARLARQLRTISRLDENVSPERGITLIGDFCHGASNSKTNRDFAFALKAAGIPFQTFATDYKRTVPEEDYREILTPIEEFRLHRYSHVIEMFRSPLPRDLVKNRARIAFWEGEHGMLDVWPFLGGDDPVIGMSDFNVDYFKRDLKAPVFKILYPFRMPTGKVPPSEEVRKRFGLSADDFVVFFNFDFGSFKRKNPQATIRAFAAALKDVPGAKLVFKTMGASAHQKELAELKSLASDLGIREQFTVITEYLPHDLLYGLTAACDVYISLHRGEGFGIGMAEAMAFGKPVVATGWSANMEYTREGVAIPVPYRLVPVKPDEYFVSMKEWAEADVDAAASALRRLHDDTGFRRDLGEKARAFIADHFWIANFKRSVNSFLG